jgi:alkylation response protein AidB-like acyl-CoA dehydrogenase
VAVDADVDEFRARCRSFLDGLTLEPVDGPDPRGERALAVARRMQAQMADAGLAGITYPVEYGGQGLSKAHEQVWREEYGRGPDVLGPLKISHGMCLPMLNEFGTPEQKAKHMARSIRADDVWCQMFSEPDAGSDVAGLKMRADRDGDEWVLNGQKVWTTLAHVCDWGLVLARTDPDRPKHNGISMFIVDMRAPGIEVRAIEQIDGGTRFNEIFFNDARIPEHHLVGELHDGWRLAIAMLSYERMTIAAGAAGGITHPAADQLMSIAKARGVIMDAALRQELVRLRCEETVKSLSAARVAAAAEVGRSPGPIGSLGKLQTARIARLTRSVAAQVLGMSAVAWSDDDERSFAIEHVVTPFQMSIAGGTDEIQRNIVGERILGLPREPVVDRDVPFSALQQAGR